MMCADASLLALPPLAPGDAVACRAFSVDGGEALPACEFVVAEPLL